MIAIIGILASVVLASLNSARERSRDAKRLAEMRQVQIALEAYFAEYGRYPNNSSTPNAACGNTSGGLCITALAADANFLKYLPNIPSDPSYAGTAYNYQYHRAGTGWALAVVLEKNGGTTRCRINSADFGPSAWLTGYNPCY